MLRRLTTFRGKKKDEGNGTPNGANGDGYANGTAPGVLTPPASPATSPSSANGMKKRFSFGPQVKKVAAEKGGTGPPPDDYVDRSVTRGDVDSTFEQFAQLIHASRRPMPTQTGDGTYIEEESRPGLFADLKSFGYKDFKTLKDALHDKASGALTDDKTMLMERIIRLVADMPDKSKNRNELTNAFINELWVSLPHPPDSYLGDHHQYRQADGSYNNFHQPMLGAANTPYARSVNPETLQPANLPDPGLIFDSLFARDTYKEHPNRVSSILYYWATLIIHDLFQTNHKDWNISMTSSYLDLSILYGDTQEDQDHMRTFKDGKIKPDCFMEQRILGMPPGCGVLLIMFNRFHNYVVEQLAMINENNRFTRPRDNLSEEQAEKAWAKYDHDLFNVGRLITCGLYINITLVDYVRTIINLNRSNTTWTLDPRAKMDKRTTPSAIFTPSGMGNQVSVEFNLVYRWHSSISKKDEEWTQAMYSRIFGKNVEDVTLPELMAGLGKWNAALPADPMKRPFAGLKRGPDGNFDDGDLVNLISDSIEDVSGCPGAQHVPKVLRAGEILGIQQARHWNCASLNEFRKFFGLAPHKTFESINPDPKVHSQLKHLYEHPDFVELYPGVVAEDYKRPEVVGVGICPTYTVSRAILSDAVTLVRSDRFYTTDYHPKSLTNWGYTEVQYDFNIEKGCVFYKLFLRAFPNHFKPNSIYAHHPMTVPDENRKIMKTLGREMDYDYDRPSAIPQRINLTSFAGANYMLERSQQFNVMWGEATGYIFGKGGLDFMLSGDSPFHAQQRKTMGAALYHSDWAKQIQAFYEHITLRLLHENSHKIANTNFVDITRDVGNIAHCHFAANIFNIPMKSEDNPRGIFTEHELYSIVAVIFIAIFFDFDPVKSFPLRHAGRALGQQLGKVVEANVKLTQSTGFASGIVDRFRENNNELKEYGIHMVRKLLESGLGPYEITWSQIVPTAVAMIPNQAQVFTQMLDFYLSEKGAPHLPEIQRLARLDTPEAFDTLMHYAMEGIRLNGTFGSYRVSTVSTTIQDGERQVPVKPGDKVFCSFVGANVDPERFPDPHEVRPDRPLEAYIHYGIGEHTCLGRDASRVALTAMLKTVGRLENLRRAPGAQGLLKKVPRPGGFYVYLTENGGSYFPFPTTWKLQFDGEVPPVPQLK